MLPRQKYHIFKGGRNIKFADSLFKLKTFQIRTVNEDPAGGKGFDAVRGEFKFKFAAAPDQSEPPVLP